MAEVNFPLSLTMNPDGTPDSTGAFNQLLGFIGQGATAYGQVKTAIANAPAQAAAANSAAPPATKGPAPMDTRTLLVIGGIGAAVLLFVALRK